METVDDETQSLFPKIDRVKERWTVVSSLVLFFAFILVQAEHQALAVLIPSEIRCYQYLNSSCDIAGTNVTAEPATSAHWWSQEELHQGQGTRTKTDGHSSCHQQKKCINFSAVEQGLLSGPAYIFAYCFLSIPMLRLADARTRVFAVGLTVSLAMVLITGFSHSYLMLLMARIGGGVGAALCNPVFLIADYFDQDKAKTFYIYGIYFGWAVGYALSAISQPLCWSWVYWVIAIAMTVTILLSLFLLREPEKVPVSVLFGRNYSIKETAQCLGTCKPFLLLIAGSSLRAVGWYGLAAWLPSVYTRKHRQDADQLGPVLATILLLGGGIGSLLGRHVKNRYTDRNRPRKSYFIAITQLVSILFIVPSLLAEDVKLSYGLLSVGILSAETWILCSMAIIQDLFPPNLRHHAHSVHVLTYTLFGGCVGPLLVPALMSARDSWSYCDGGVAVALAILIVLSYSLASLLFWVEGCLMTDEEPPSDETILMSYETSDLELDSSTEAEYQV